jgi:hypothetical protein
MSRLFGEQTIEEVITDTFFAVARKSGGLILKTNGWFGAWLDGPSLTHTMAPPQLEPAPAVQPKQ